MKSVDVLDDNKVTEMRDQAKQEVADGAKEADAADLPDPADAGKNVWADVDITQVVS